MQQIRQEIIAVYIIDIAIIGVGPVRWPRVHQHECVPSIDEPLLTFNHGCTLYRKCVGPTELGVESLVGDMSAPARRTRMPLLLCMFLIGWSHLIARLPVLSLLLLLFLLGRLRLILPGLRPGFGLSRFGLSRFRLPRLRLLGFGLLRFLLFWLLSAQKC